MTVLSASFLDSSIPCGRVRSDSRKLALRAFESAYGGDAPVNLRLLGTREFKRLPTCALGVQERGYLRPSEAIRNCSNTSRIAAEAE